LPSIPSGWRLNAYRGQAYLSQNATQQAIADFDKAIELDATSELAFGGRSFAYLRKRDYESALQDAQEMVRLAPETEGGYMLEAEILTKTKDFTRIIEATTRGIERLPKSAKLYDLRGVAYARLEQMDEAKRDAVRAMELEPLVGIARAAHAYKQFQAGDHDAAIAESNLAMLMAPTLALARCARGCGRCEKGLTDEAIADFTACVEEYENLTDDLKSLVLKARGFAYDRNGEKEKSEADAAESKRIADTAAPDTARR
jgi:tetratricopeptide (TPR) repeat protein